jgi:hypothetical protein
MIQTGYELPLSLAICDRLATDWDRTSCHGGVFMENLSSSYGVRSRWLRDDDLVYPCNDVAERYRWSCYLMVTSRILQANGYDWRAAAKTCHGVEARWAATCFQSLGRDASGFTRQRPRSILPLCRVAASAVAECLYGAARDVAANYSRVQPAAELCRLAPRPRRARCFEGVGTMVSTFKAGIAARRAACAANARGYLRPCLAGAGA